MDFPMILPVVKVTYFILSDTLLMFQNETTGCLLLMTVEILLLLNIFGVKNVFNFVPHFLKF